MCNKMTAIAIISSLTAAKANGNKLETAINVLCELKKMKSIKGLPTMAIRRAIKMQENTIKNLK